MKNTLAKPRILIYQNQNAEILKGYLSAFGYDIIVTDNSNFAACIKAKNYNLCILDFNLITNSLDTLQRVKHLNDNMPVIIMSNYVDDFHAIMALKQGADDYVRLPCNMEEVYYRVKRLMQIHKTESAELAEEYQIGAFTLHVQDNELVFNEEDEEEDSSYLLKLTTKECLTLAILAANMGKTVPASNLLNYIWYEDTYFNKRALDVNICSLRKFLKADPTIFLETMRGIGYRLTIE